MTVSEKIIRILCDPSLFFRWLWRNFPVGSVELRMKFDAFERTYYAFGIYHAAKLAKILGLPKISVLEFGVAHGNGLLQMEKIADEVSEKFGVDIEMYGFDLGSGLPPIGDYRDLPYIWQEGLFKMDYPALTRQLKRSKLIIGDVKDTIKTFYANYNPAPIGFVVFDLDLYTSTVAALKIFETDNKFLLPRVLCFFDDVIDVDAKELHNEYTGELLAIKEFNEQNHDRKIAKINGLGQKRYFRSAWPEAMYAMHVFRHELYNRPILK